MASQRPRQPLDDRFIHFHEPDQTAAVLLAASRQEVAELRAALEAAAAVHMRDDALLRELQPKQKPGLPAAGACRPPPSSDRACLKMAAPVYAGLSEGSEPPNALPFPDDAALADGCEAACASGDAIQRLAGQTPPAPASAGPPGGHAHVAWTHAAASPHNAAATAAADTGSSSGELRWKERYLASFTRTLQLEFKATAWRAEHQRAMRALRAEVGPDVPLESVLAASGGDLAPGAVAWRGRAATIGLLREQLREAQMAAQGGVAQTPAATEAAAGTARRVVARLTSHKQPATSAAETRRAEAEVLRAEAATAREAAAEARNAAQRAATRRAILEGEVKAMRSHLGVLLRKAENDDRLIAALQAALKAAAGGGDGSLPAAAAATSSASGTAAAGGRFATNVLFVQGSDVNGGTSQTAPSDGAAAGSSDRCSSSSGHASVAPVLLRAALEAVATPLPAATEAAEAVAAVEAVAVELPQACEPAAAAVEDAAPAAPVAQQETAAPGEPVAVADAQQCLAQDVEPAPAEEGTAVMAAAGAEQPAGSEQPAMPSGALPPCGKSAVAEDSPNAAAPPAAEPAAAAGGISKVAGDGAGAGAPDSPAAAYEPVPPQAGESPAAVAAAVSEPGANAEVPPAADWRDSQPAGQAGEESSDAAAAGEVSKDGAAAAGDAAALDEALAASDDEAEPLQPDSGLLVSAMAAAFGQPDDFEDMVVEGSAAHLQPRASGGAAAAITGPATEEHPAGPLLAVGLAELDVAAPELLVDTAAAESEGGQDAAEGEPDTAATASVQAASFADDESEPLSEGAIAAARAEPEADSPSGNDGEVATADDAFGTDPFLLALGMSDVAAPQASDDGSTTAEHAAAAEEPPENELPMSSPQLQPVDDEPCLAILAAASAGDGDSDAAVQLAAGQDSTTPASPVVSVAA